MQIFYIVFPIFLIIALGYLLRKWKIVSDEWVSVLNNFVYYVALPAIILTSFWGIDWKTGGTLKVLFFNILALILFSALVLFGLSFTKFSRKTKAAVFLSVMVGNTVYMGFPIVSQAFPNNFNLLVAAASVHLVLSLVFAVLAGEYFVQREKKPMVYINNFLKNPLIIGLFIGLVFSLFGFKGVLADVIKKPLLMLAATASPIALFALGSFFHGKSIARKFKTTFTISILKILVYPLFILALAGAIKFDILGAKVSALVAAMPTAVTAFVVAEKYKLEEETVANAILISTAISIATISMFLFKLM
jgi:predicted permease